jgi:CRP-like cAMP-binding protein
VAKKEQTDNATAETVMKALQLEKVLPNLTAEEASEFFPKSGLYSYEKDEYIIEQGEESKDLFVVIAGTVAITQTFGTASGQVATLEAGKLFGEIALVAQGVRVASAIAGEGAKVFCFVQEDIERAMKAKPALTEHLRDLALKRLNANTA